MVLKNTLNGDKIPICRVEDLEITLVGPDLPVKVRLPTKSEHLWRSLSEVRAAEVQCMQLSLALLARHESEMYVTIEADKNTTNYLQSNYHQEQRGQKPRQTTDAIKKHLEECEKVFGTNTKPRSKVEDTSLHQSTEKQLRNLTMSNEYVQERRSMHSYPSSSSSTSKHHHSSHGASDRFYRKTSHDPSEHGDSYNRSHPPIEKQQSLKSSSGHSKTKTNLN